MITLVVLACLSANPSLCTEVELPVASCGGIGWMAAWAAWCAEHPGWVLRETRYCGEGVPA